MTRLNGCEIPEDLYYFVEKHCWAKPLDNGRIRVGVTIVATKMAGQLTAVTPRSKRIGQEIVRGKSIGTMESSKYVGPVPTPVTGTLIAVNEAISGNPNLVTTDPYVQGWIAEFEVADWNSQAAELVTGQAAQDAYEAFMEQEDISCEG